MYLEAARAMLQFPPTKISWSIPQNRHGAFIWDEYGEEVSDWNAGPRRHAGLEEVHIRREGDDDFYFSYQGAAVRVPYRNERGDNLIAIHTLAGLVRKDSEFRFCLDSWHSSDVCFMVLPPRQWHELETEYGVEAVAFRFLKLDPDFATFCEAAFQDRQFDDD